MVKEGLYIANMKADVDDISTFAFTYKNSDVENPEAIKNSYSKSVELKGTNTNNKIFGEIWNLDREIADGDNLIGANFNPKVRVPFELFDNGELLESGYIKLDSINIEKNNVVYSLTLFGELGNFFYNLMYNESDEEISMADLKLGLDNEPDDKNKKLLQWDAEYIKGSWDKLKNDFNPDDKSVDNWITAAPTYSGYYDDFSNDKVLVQMDSLSPETRDLLPSSMRNENKDYIPSDGYGLLTAQREMSEWEVRDLRSLYQRPAIKTSLLLDAIGKPENNGGYKVVWDDEFKNSPYYTQSYIISNRLSWEDGATNLTAVDVDVAESKYTGEKVEFNILNHKTGTKYFDFSDMQSPQLQMTLNENIYTDNTNSEKLYTSRFKLMENDNIDFGYSASPLNIYGAFVYKVRVFNDGVELPEYTLTKIVNLWDNYNIKYGRELLVNYIQNLIGSPFNEQLIGGANKVRYPNGDTYYQSEDFEINLKLPSLDKVSISIEKSHITLRLFNIFEGGWHPISLTTEQRATLGSVSIDNAFKNKFNPLKSGKKSDKIKYWYTLQYATSFDVGSNFYDGISSNVQNIDVTKSILFDSLGTPFKILTDFAKLFNLRFNLIHSDFENKGTVQILQRKNYFKNEVVDISKQIDYSKSFNIIPTTSEYKFYKFGIENEDTYAYTLYKKRYSDDYSTYTYNSNYNFNNDTNDLFDGCDMGVAIDYRLNSPYFCTGKVYEYVQYPQICLTPLYQWQLWHNEESYEKDMYGLQSFALVNKIEDDEKMCFFDKENENVEMIALAFFNGFKTYDDTMINNKMPYLLSDNLPIMSNLNDDSACFIYGRYDYRTQPKVLMGRKYAGDAFDSVIGHWITELPQFSPNLRVDGKVVNSFYFKQPQVDFVKDDYSNATLLYPKYWRDYIGDLYSDSAKQVQCYCFIKDKPEQAMRKLYYFNNSLWSLNEITDYNYREYTPVQCTFVKIQDKSSYIF